MDMSIVRNEYIVYLINKFYLVTFLADMKLRRTINLSLLESFIKTA